jgi:hypothetical protein
MNIFENGPPNANDNYILPESQRRYQADLRRHRHAIRQNLERLETRSGFCGINAFDTGIGAAFCDDAMAEAIRGAIRAELNRRAACPDFAARCAVEGIDLGGDHG